MRGLAVPQVLLPLFVCVLESGLVAAGQPPRSVVECRLYPNGKSGKCESSSDGTLRVPPALVRRASFGPEGLSAIVAGDRFYFLNRQGRTAPALPFDNGPDPFADGLARTIKNGKVGFLNARLEVVIPATWDFAFPFEEGVAVVCSGCAAQRAGEHSEMIGGKWGYIDRRGAVVLPVESDRDLLPSRAAAVAALRAAPSR